MILKALSYRVLVIINHLILLYLFTGNINISIKITIVSAIITTVIYMMCEKYWKVK